MIDKRGALAGLLLTSMFLAGVVAGMALQQIVRPGGAGVAFVAPGTPGLVVQGEPGLVGPGPTFSGPGMPADSGARILNFRGPEAGARGVGGVYTMALVRQLGLSERVEEDIQAIVDRHRAAMDSVLLAVRPRVDEEFRAMNDEIRARLTDAQRARYDSLITQGFTSLGAEAPPWIVRGGAFVPPPAVRPR